MSFARLASACFSALLILLIGSSPTLAAEGETAARPCASHPRELTARAIVPLYLMENGKIHLTKASGCIVVTDGMEGSAALLQLPDFTEPYAVHVAAPVSDTVVHLRLVLLDATFEAGREIPSAQFKRRGGEVSADVFVNSENSKERYLLVLVDAARIGESDSRVTMRSNVAFVGTGYWISGSDDTQIVNVVDSGTVIVSLIGPQWPEPTKKKSQKRN